MAFCKKIKRYLLSISLQAKIIGMVVGLTLFMGTVLYMNSRADIDGTALNIWADRDSFWIRLIYYIL